MRVYKLLDPTEVRLWKEWVGGAKGPIEKPSVVLFFPGSFPLLDPTEVRLGKEWVGGAKGPIEKPSCGPVLSWSHIPGELGQ